MITETDKAWAAAIFDFQAHVIRRSNGHRAEGSEHVTIYVDTKISQISLRLSEMTGTKPEPHSNGHADLKLEWLRRGCAEHCPEAHVHLTAEDVNMPPTVKWSVSGAAAAIVLWNLYPYMATTKTAPDGTPPKEPWDWAMAVCFASTRLSGRGAAAALGAIRRLHALGWDLPPLFRDTVAATSTAPPRLKELASGA